MTELETLLEMGEEFARKVLLVHRHKELVPTYHLIGADDSHHIMHCPWANDLQKSLHFAMVKNMAQEITCRAYVFVSEGWSLHLDKDVPITVQPRNSPDRIEVVNITAGNITGNITTVLHMVRDLSPGMRNRLIALEPMTQMYNSEGRMIDGLIQPQKGP
jgi:hypothetical protein